MSHTSFPHSPSPEEHSGPLCDEVHLSVHHVQQSADPHRPRIIEIGPNRPNLSPLFYAHFSLFLSMEGTRSASPLCTAYSDLIPQFALSRSSLNCQAAMCHRHPKESGRVVPLLGPCTLLATTFEQSSVQCH